jgi:hypothetical protein
MMSHFGKRQQADNRRDQPTIHLKLPTTQLFSFGLSFFTRFSITVLILFHIPCPGLLVELLTRLTYNPKRVSERVRSRPGHIQELVPGLKAC